ncbi:membrane protein [Cellvibrio zantedeschiae]|uniref:Membrane protein n=1 Tax=Cellvibrio zantedeschiae TaxID=1237077 RepID=A0ABQ3B792_9GAMM|nr:acyltransferase [Cellvibrio zantedeschiae]GGY77017.1 membrane protein [Cellvibrio zantedeschiae]
MTQAVNLPLHEITRKRLIELDWLRVMVFGLLIFYHVGMLYVEGWGWHYKSTYTSKFLTNIMLWSNQWRMSLLFMISGAAVSFLLASQSWWQFIVKRVPILLLPLLFGMLVVVVPQVYVEANSKGIINCPNYWHFWYAYLDQNSPEFADHKTLGSMHLTWNHLWFLLYLLAYSLIVWAAYPLLMSSRLMPLRNAFAKQTPMSVVIVLPIMISYFLGLWLDEKNPVTHNFVQDWFNHARSLLVFLIGFVLVRMPLVWNRFAGLRWHFLVTAAITFSYILFSFNGGSLGDGGIAKSINRLFWTANGWFWMLTLIAWAQHCFHNSNPILRYLNRGVYCFYIVHQTLIIAIAYFLVPKTLGGFWEPMLIILMVISGCILMFEIIKRLPVLPIFFGIQKGR